jgi:hypothetical protein
MNVSHRFLDFHLPQFWEIPLQNEAASVFCDFAKQKKASNAQRTARRPTRAAL